MGRKNWNQDYFKISGSVVEDEDMTTAEREKLASARAQEKRASRKKPLGRRAG